MEERRRARRQKLYPQPHLIDVDNPVGTVVDITTYGIKINAIPIYKIGQSIHFIIIFNKSIIGRKTVSVEARVMWRMPDEHTSNCIYGLEFVNVSPADSSVIVALMIRLQELEQE